MKYHTLFNLAGKTALVTGGAGILGQKFCEGLAESGANVIVVDLEALKSKKIASSLSKKYGVKCLGLKCDISDPRKVSDMVDICVDEFGSIDILHNNAASKSDDLEAFFAPFEEYSLSEWRKIMSVNIDAMFLLDQAVGKVMKRNTKGGTIIHTSSIYGILAPDQRIYEGSEYQGRSINTPAVYSASKAAVIGLTKYLAAYWAKDNIRVNCLTPGGVESGQNEIFIKKYTQRIPLERMAQATELVCSLLYLSSDASSYVTGQNIIVDGGLSIW